MIRLESDRHEPGSLGDIGNGAGNGSSENNVAFGDGTYFGGGGGDGTGNGHWEGYQTPSGDGTGYGNDIPSNI